MECVICYENFSGLKSCSDCNKSVCCDMCYNKLKCSSCPICRSTNFKPIVIPLPGKFSELFDCSLTAYTLEGTYNAISEVGLWEELKNFVVNEHQGFTFSSDPLLLKIMNATENIGVGHSGSSWGFSMRHMDYIAKNSWNNYVNKCVILRSILK